MPKLIGTNQTPKDLVAKITGRAKYTEDFRAEGMLFAKLLLSPVPRGRVRRLDTARALAIPGVIAVATADDVPAVEGNAEPVLTNEPRYQGQPIAAVCAIDEYTAAEAIAALGLQMERLPFVLDPLDSLKPGGPDAVPGGNTQPLPPPGGGGGGGGRGGAAAGRGGAAGAGAAAAGGAAGAAAGGAAPGRGGGGGGGGGRAAGGRGGEAAGGGPAAVGRGGAAAGGAAGAAAGGAAGGGAAQGRGAGGGGGGGQPAPTMMSLKWTAEQMAALLGNTFPEGEFPGLEGPNNWQVGDIAEAFARSAVVVAEPIVHQSQSHHPLEPRSAMAYWQNGKCYLHCSTQSVARTVAGHAGRLEIEPADLVLISEYTGGGFGSKISGTVTDVIPAILSRKANNRPVMMRVTRDEETYFGRARPGLQGWVKMGFRADGRLLAMDLILIQDNGPFGPQGDRNSAGSTASLMLQPETMRFRSIAIWTNTPPRAAQRAPGGAQIVPMLTPTLEKAARQLRVDRVDMMLLNAPENPGVYGPVGNNGQRARLTSSFVKEAITMAKERFRYDERKAELSGQTTGSKVTGIGVSWSPYSGGSRGVDGMLIIRPDGKLTIHSGVGNLGTHSVFDTSMVAAEQLDVPWEEVEVVWGDTSKGLPWSSSQSGSQTTHAHTRSNLAAGQDAVQKLKEIAARDLGGSAANYVVGGGRVYRRGGNPNSGMTFARAAQRAIELGGKYDGHDFPRNEEGEIQLNAMTVAAVETHLRGQGLVGVGRDNFGGTGQIQSSVVTFAVIELDRETGMFDIKEWLSVADCGTVLNPRSLEAQTLAGGLQGMSQARFERWAFDPKWGLNQNRRFYTVKPFSMLDIPEQFDFAAVNIADPETPVGSRGIGEPPVGAGAAVVVSAIYDAVGVAVNRTPVTPDKILNALEGGATGYSLLQTHV